MYCPWTLSLDEFASIRYFTEILSETNTSNYKIQTHEFKTLFASIQFV